MSGLLGWLGGLAGAERVDDWFARLVGWVGWC